MPVTGKVPSDILSYLAADEKLLKAEKIHSQKTWICVTDKRFIIHKRKSYGKKIVESSYRHISSIEFKKEVTSWLSIAGIILVGFYLIGYSFNPIIRGDLGFFLILIIGIFVTIIGLLPMPVWTIHILGKDPIILNGELEGIMRIIRQYRKKVEI